MLDAGYRYKDPDAAFPVFLHPESGEEYALARRETKTAAGYRGFAIDAGPDVTLEEDLARRDLTVNAMARDAKGKLIDPFNGRDDLAAGLLRHVTPAFAEDPVRLLRIARFAAKLGGYGFHVAHGTHRLMKRMATGTELAALQPSRIWQELRRALEEPQPWRFLQVLQRCGALAALLPELADALGDGVAHGSADTAAPLQALRCAAEAQLPPHWRLAALMGAVEVDIESLLRRLPVDKAAAQSVHLLRTQLPRYQALPTAPAAAWMAFLESARALRQPTAFDQLVTACRCAAPQVSAALPARLSAARSAAAGVDAHVLQAAGLQGAELGKALRQAREQALTSILADA